MKDQDVAATRQASGDGSGNRSGRVLLVVQLALVAIAGPVYVGMTSGSMVQALWSVPIGVGVVLAMHMLFSLIDKSVRRAEGKERSDQRPICPAGSTLQSGATAAPARSSAGCAGSRAR